MKRLVGTLFLVFAPLAAAGFDAASANRLAESRACRECDLSGLDLSGARLWKAELAGANLSGADLSRANLGNANLSGADLSGAVLTKTYLTQANLGGEESWYSGATQRDMVQPRWLCVTHMFNHQTHHRGQVSQMLHAAGLTPPVSDIIFMPKDF